MNQSPVVTLDRATAPAAGLELFGHLGGPSRYQPPRAVHAELFSGADGTVGAYQRPIALLERRRARRARRRCGAAPIGSQPMS